MALVREHLLRATRILHPGSGEGAAREARLLLAEVLGVPAGNLLVKLDEELSENNAQRLAAMVSQRCEGQPISQIIGRRLFWGREFIVTNAVLDPRPETEILISKALEQPFSRLLDLGTGSGCLLVSLLAEAREKGWEVRGLGLDISPSALQIAQKNIQKFGLEDMATLRCSDWWGQLNAGEEHYDLIVSNPPYIGENEKGGLSPELLKWEPQEALFAGEDGLNAYKSILSKIIEYLAPGGRVFLEIGCQQVKPVSQLMLEADLKEIQLHRDFDERPRVLSATC